MRKINYLPLLFLLAFGTRLPAQVVLLKDPEITVDGCLNVCYAGSNDSTGTGTPRFLSDVGPYEGFNLNLVSLEVKMQTGRTHAKAILQFGDIPALSLPPDLQVVSEAYGGILLGKKLWLDAGIFGTHNGTESILLKDNLTESWAAPTFYQPYIETGLRLKRSFGENFSASLYLINGYNLFHDNNKQKSAGLLLTWDASDALSFGYDNYVGDDSPEGSATTHVLFYNNLYASFEKGRLKMSGGIDYCRKQHADLAFGTLPSSMLSALLSARIACCEKLGFYGRYEYFNDPDGIMSGTVFTDNGVQSGLLLNGLTLGAEYVPQEKSYLRIEARGLQAASHQTIFQVNHRPGNQRIEWMLALGVWL